MREHDDPAFNGPTRERALVANGNLAHFPIEDRNSRGNVGIYFQVFGPVNKMYLSGQITSAEARAAAKFNADYVLAQMVKVTVKYALELQMASAVGRSGGTPVSQMTESAAARLNFDERRANHAGYYYNACKALGNEKVSQWLTLLLSEETLPGAEKPVALADIGYAFMNYTGKQQRQAAGATLTKWWLGMLARHYGFDD